MAINATILELIAKLIAHTGKPCRIASLGYPDMLLTEPQIEQLCGPEALAALRFREDSDGIARWHRIDGQVSRLAESISLFAALGAELHCFDITASRGFEIVADLNFPLPPETHGQYDIVYDGGTMEHCFNVPQVIANILSLTKVGGYIVHVNPINYFNHGFYSFHPDLLSRLLHPVGERAGGPDLFALRPGARDQGDGAAGHARVQAIA